MMKYFEIVDLIKTISIVCGVVIFLCFTVSNCTDNLLQQNRLLNENKKLCLDTGGSIIPQNDSFICIKNK